MHREGHRSGVCGSCGAALAPMQRYCVRCGERVASRSSLLLALLRLSHLRRATRATGPAPRELAAGASPAGEPARGGTRSLGGPFDSMLDGFALPSARTSVLLVLAFAGFGILIGDVAATKPGYALSAARRPLKLIVAAAPASARAEAGAGARGTEPPATAPEATPEASESSGAESPSTSSSRSRSAKSGASPSEGGEQESASSRSGAEGSGGSQGSPSSKLPAVKHVFVIMLSQEPFATAFGPSSAAPYLAHALEHRGELLVRYYGVADGPLANGIALLSGQGPTPQTVAGCPTFADIVPGNAGAREQIAGEGCVYPSAARTLIGQLAHKHLNARAYVQGIDEGASTTPACAHPPLGGTDATAQPANASAYVTARNPLVYFHSVIDTSACAGADVGLRALARDLRSAASTPALSYIAPDRCNDGSPSACAPGAAAGMPAAEGLLKRIVPEILTSRAYRKNGLLIITVDGAPTSGEFADTSSCCGQPLFPNLPAPSGRAALLGHEGGGQVGALLLSPFVKAGSVSQEAYNHFSLLRTIEDLFGVPHLGYAALSKVSAFEPALFAAR